MQKGFTLAEVLITLAIIGIVAALTIPSLASGYQKRVLTSQLQKTYSEISQAAATALANEMSSDFTKSKTIRDMTFVKTYLNATDGGHPFAESYGYVDDPNASYYPSNEDDVYIGSNNCGTLKSGAAICVDDHAVGLIDINGGDKGPNLIVRDAFVITFNPDASISTSYSMALENIINNDWDIDKYDVKVKSDNNNSGSGGKKPKRKVKT